MEIGQGTSSNLESRGLVRDKNSKSATTGSRVPRGFLERQRMMDEFESGGFDFQPSAKIIRSSKRPISTSSGDSTGQEYNVGKVDGLKRYDTSNDETSFGEIHENRDVTLSMFGSDVTKPNNGQRKVGAVISESIVERPICQPKKVSRFKMKQAQLNNEQQGGFPSFDIPVGTLTRKGKVDLDTKGIFPHVKKMSDDISSSDADKIIANMSQDEIIQSVEEIKSILSNDTIQFLKNRKHNQTQTQQVAKFEIDPTRRSLLEEESAKVSEKLVSQKNHVIQDERERSFKVLANIQTEEELEEAFRKAMGNLDDTCVSTEEGKEEGSELLKAAKLLRSTAPRQRTLGAKTVCEILENRVLHFSELADQDWYEDASSYPDILPVSLRCLLDTPSPQNNMQLISYILRAINALVILFSHPEHRVGLSITCVAAGNDADNVLQQDFMYDAVLTSPGYHIYSREKASVIENTAFGDECYATNASAASVKSDAKAFYNDPAWTLLSKMRFIPCISHILSALCRLRQKVSYGSPIIASGTVMAICGILSSLGIRSPGAAVAIAQHKDLLPSLFTLTLEPENSGDNAFVVDTAAAFPVVYMSSVLCGQSRIAAESLQSVMESVVYIVANDAANQQEFQLQQWSLIFWRKLLRYGMGISYLPTLLPMSVKQLASGVRIPFSLAAEYFSAFAVICQCVKVARYQDVFESESKTNILDDSVREILAMSGLWFSSHAQNCIKFLGESFDSDSTRDRLKLISAKLRFLSSYIDASSPKDIHGKMLPSTNGNFVSIIQVGDIIMALNALAESKFLEGALSSIFRSESIAATVTISMPDEATCCALIEAFFSSVSILKGKIDEASHSTEQIEIDSSYDAAFDSLMVKTYDHSSAIIANFACGRYKDSSPKSRILWTNKAHFSILHCHLVAMQPLLLSAIETLKPAPQDLQSFCFSLIGSLQRGEEAKAVELFKNDLFFTMITKHGAVEKTQVASSLRELITRELSESQTAQAQLDHSNKLEGRTGLMLESAGHFGLKSLRTEYDVMFGDPEHSLNESFTLPLGKDWLWKLLSGTIAVNNEDSKTLTTVSTVIKSILLFLLYVEESGMDFSNSLQPGSKIYYLLNSCLYPEAVISDKEYNKLFSKLFTLYQTAASTEGKETARAFIVTCYEHSKQCKDYTRDKADYDSLTDLFFTDTTGAEDMELSSKDFKAFDEFVDDLCAAFMDFGAQYSSFVYTVRFLLAPFMPVRIRNRTLENLKDILHLLTTEDESKDEEKQKLKTCLQYFYAGGLSILDYSQRDHSSTLDILASALKAGSFDLVQRQDGFFFLYAVGCLARNIASNAVKCECGVKSMERRLHNLKKDIWTKISAIAIAAMKEKCASADQLASIVVRECMEGTACDLDFVETIQNLRDLYHKQTNFVPN